MDIYGLAIAQIQNTARPPTITACAEDCYYSAHMGAQHFRPVLLRAAAVAATVIVMLGLPLI